LDKAHLQHWGFYWSEEKLAEVSEAVQEVLEADAPEAVLAGLREEVETRATENGEAQKKAAEAKALKDAQQAAIDAAKDLAEIPQNVKEGLKIIPVTHVREVLAAALVRQPEPVEWDEAAEEAAAAARQAAAPIGAGQTTH
jgi:uncharacterized protein YggE